MTPGQVLSIHSLHQAGARAGYGGFACGSSSCSKCSIHRLFSCTPSPQHQRLQETRATRALLPFRIVGCRSLHAFRSDCACSRGLLAPFLLPISSFPAANYGNARARACVCEMNWGVTEPHLDKWWHGMKANVHTGGLEPRRSCLRMYAHELLDSGVKKEKGPRA